MKKLYFFGSLCLISLLIGIFTYPKLFPYSEEKIANQNTEEIKNDVIPEIIKEPETITYNEKPATNTSLYFEKVVKINSEYLYFAYPITITKTNPPRLIYYSHGSNTTVSKDFNDQFMKDLQGYAKYFTSNNYAFAASSMHGANWGSEASVEDIKASISTISSKYLIKEKINLIGFSMGGLPTFNYMFKYPKTVNSTFFLAPTSRDYDKTKLNLIKNIPIKIIHGDKDVNVPLYLSNNLINRNKSFGFTNMTLKIIKGAGHFDIDTEKKATILEFFENNE